MPPMKMSGDGRKAKNPKKTFLRLLGYLKPYMPRMARYNENRHKKQAWKPQIDIAIKDYNHDKEEEKSDTSGKPR